MSVFSLLFSIHVNGKVIKKIRHTFNITNINTIKSKIRLIIAKLNKNINKQYTFRALIDDENKIFKLEVLSYHSITNTCYKRIITDKMFDKIKYLFMEKLKDFYFRKHIYPNKESNNVMLHKIINNNLIASTYEPCFYNNGIDKFVDIKKRYVNDDNYYMIGPCYKEGDTQFCTVTGTVHKKESFLNAAVRELKEELRISVQKNKMEKIKTYYRGSNIIVYYCINIKFAKNSKYTTYTDNTNNNNTEDADDNNDDVNKDAIMDNKKRKICVFVYGKITNIYNIMNNIKSTHQLNDNIIAIDALPIHVIKHMNTTYDYKKYIT